MTRVDDYYLEATDGRLYVHGPNGFAAKGTIRAYGGQFDTDRKRWWVSATDRDDAEELIRILNEFQPGRVRSRDNKEIVTVDTQVIGRASYRGRDGYLVLHDGDTRYGYATKLATRDGSLVFWARDPVTITSRYQTPKTFGDLERLAGRDPELNPPAHLRCRNCGLGQGQHQRRDVRGKIGLVCGECANAPGPALRFPQHEARARLPALN